MVILAERRITTNFIFKMSTSETDPLEVDFVPLPSQIYGQLGKGSICRRLILGMTFAPGKVQSFSKSGKCWRRDLDADLERLNSHYNCTMLVSLMEKHEYEFVNISPIFTKVNFKNMIIILTY